MKDTRRNGGYRLVARENHPHQLGHVESPHVIACPYCGHKERLVYVELWDPVPGFASWTEHGAPPYVMQLRPAIKTHYNGTGDNCAGRVQAGGFLILPKEPMLDGTHMTIAQVRQHAATPPVTEFLDA